MKKSGWIITPIRIIVLALVIAVVYSIDFLGLKLDMSSPKVILPVLVLAFLQSIVISYPVIRSSWHGWKLMLTIFFVYYGTTFFMSQIEAIVFLQYFVDIIPEGTILGTFINGAISTVIISPVALAIYNKFKSSAVEHSAEDANNIKPLTMPTGKWVWKIALIAVIYIMIYFIFGALVAKPLAGRAFDEYYANLQLPAWIIPFQFLRGVIWTLITVPVIRMMRGKVWETKLAAALLLSVLFSSLLIPPNEFMPSAIRLAHFVETLTSMFIFGWICVWILYGRKIKNKKPAD